MGLHVGQGDNDTIAHEVMFEQDFTHIQDQAMFIGPALPRSRFVWAMVAVALLVAALLGRACWMQLVSAGAYRLRADQNRLRVEYLPAQRGVIRDRQGKVLAENVPSFDLRVIPWLLPRDAETRDEYLAKVGREVNMPLSQMQAIIASSTNPAESLTLLRDIPYNRAVAATVLTGNDPALHIAMGNKRRYLFSQDLTSLSHILGYVGNVSPQELQSHPGYRQTDNIGKAGVEYTYESILRGTPGQRSYEVDAQNKVTSLVGNTPPQDGQDLTLTLDLDIQRVTENALRQGLANAHVLHGAAVVMDPRDGSILAIASLPSYDDNLFSGTVSSTYYAKLLADPDKPLLPRAWAGVYPSGSTVKPVVATAALAEKVITPDTTVNSTGGIKVGQTFFPDWKAGGHGITNVRKALAWSINTFFYIVGGGYESFVGLGVDRLTNWMRRFGLGSDTGIDLPGESSGFVPSKEWKERTKGDRWYVGDTYNLSIGQGDLLVTPLQVANFTAVVANGGHQFVPHVGLNPDLAGTTSSAPLADPGIIQTVRLGMRDTVVYGSGHALSVLPFTVAGKTGTAQWRNDRPNHAWFTCFAPFDNPQVAVTVLLEEGVEGSRTAIPVADQILRAWYAKYGTPPAPTKK